jgi:putative ABC transport system permease protein
MMRVQAVSPGFEASNVLTLRTALPLPEYGDRVRREDFYRRVLADIRALPGVESAAYISGLPMLMSGGISLVLLAGEVDERSGNQITSYRFVTSQYFGTLRVPLLQGRDFNDGDTRDAQLVAIVSESFVRERLPNTDPIGRTVTVRGETRAIVGIVGDIKVRGLERTSEPQLYVPINQALDAFGENYLPKDLVVRATRNAVGLLPAIRGIVRRVAPNQPISSERLLSELVGDQTATRRAQVGILGALAGLALIITAVGIHGLLAFTVAQRDREIAVRLALGAEPRSVGRMIVGEGMRMALLGAVPGIVVAYFAARAMRSMLFGIPPEDPLTFVSVVVLCVVTTVGACLIPALRAARIQPMTALRGD